MNLRTIALVFSTLVLNDFSIASTLSRTGQIEDKVTATKSITCLAGGGSDDAWAEGWRHLLTAANGGDVVIIRADGHQGGYEDWIYNDPDHHGFPIVNSVTTIQLEQRRDGDDPQVIARVREAELIFFAGGDQYDYIRLIKGTRLHQVLDFALQIRKVPFAGTSAGMAILGEFDFSARWPSPRGVDELVSSQDVISNPVGDFVALEGNFLVSPFLKSVITDTHFSQRHREGRLVGFMARAVFDGLSGVDAQNIRGIGADEGTAICFDSRGYAKVLGENKAYFLKGNSPIERIRPGEPLEWISNGQAITAYVIDGHNAKTAWFDLNAWKGFGGEAYHWSIDGMTDEPRQVPQ